MKSNAIDADEVENFLSFRDAFDSFAESFAKFDVDLNNFYQVHMPKIPLLDEEMQSDFTTQLDLIQKRAQALIAFHNMERTTLHREREEEKAKVKFKIRQ